ncbi:TRAP transporter, DctM subunit [Desulfocurvibacter africanus PCS]|uniref:TRAP transporter, DctM subunit n=1 Tax=Desulfocurvibacter africanus PCS TaxID=1262666 RepID=M5PQR6_DESAF|nr:TRAP transporter large permease subunit [Desulfocurvibacter africanus]EMG36702.1 TRAP transporter, DctM subunit [Desulfocurvibacter africanus PCS]
MDYLAAWMFLAMTVLLMAGFPVSFTLLGVSLAFGLAGFGWDFFNLLPLRIWGVMSNFTLTAVPLFIFMGMTMERSGIATKLIEAAGMLLGRLHGGMAVAVVAVGALLGASTGIVGATVVTMGLLALPPMLRAGYSHSLATGAIAASGTLGQIIPPSIVLVLLGDIIGVPVGQLFVSAVVPSLLTVTLYILFILVYAALQPKAAPAIADLRRRSGGSPLLELLQALVPPLVLIMAVLGSIFAGIASPTEAAGVGAIGALLLSIGTGRFSLDMLKQVMDSTTRLTAMIFTILVGATAFGLVFRGLGGDMLVRDFIGSLPFGPAGALFIIMAVIFVAGFFLDFVEITFIHIPVVAPIMIELGFDPAWLAVIFALNLQTSFLTPPFGFSLFYLKGVCPDSVSTLSIYKGIIPFVILQLVVLALVATFPALATWLPAILE